MRFGLLDSRSGLRPTLAVLFAGLLLVSAIVVGLYLTGFDAVAAIRDRATSNLPEAGLISYLGIALMGTAGSLALFGAFKSSSVPLASLALFCGLFAIDDAFLLHEGFGDWEVIVFAFYGLLALLVLFLFRASAGCIPWPVVMALAAFAVSVVIDVLWGGFLGLLQPSSQSASFLLRLGYVLEDIPKFAGIVVFLSFAAGETVFGARRPKTWATD